MLPAAATETPYVASEGADAGGSSAPPTRGGPLPTLRDEHSGTTPAP